MLNVSSQSLDFALANVELHGDTDLFPLPFEYSAIRASWQSLRRSLTTHDLDSWRNRPPRRSLTPKGAYGFRVGTQLDPLEHLLASALVYEVSGELESSRVPTSEARVHSYRVTAEALDENKFYSSDWNYSTFHEESLRAINDTQDGWVVLADISDFYLRLYFHPLENALRAACASHDHVRVLLKFIKAWNQNVSYGIPIGPAFSRILAETAISDIDYTLLSEGLDFYRFSDDFRIVVPDRRSGHRALELLADTLYANHGLTLNAGKTEVIPNDVYIARWQERAERPTVPSLRDKMKEFLGEDIELPVYPDEIATHDLPEEVLSALRQLDLPELLRVELEERANTREPDYSVVRFILSHLAAVFQEPAFEIVRKHSSRLHPIAPSLARYLHDYATYVDRDSAGDHLTELLTDPVAGTLPFHRAWWLEPLSALSDVVDAQTLVAVHAAHDDEFTRAQVLRALARQGSVGWLRSKRRDFGNLPVWSKRAFLAAASCLPRDERGHWYDSVRSGLDELEESVRSWARSQGPFSASS